MNIFFISIVDFEHKIFCFNRELSRESQYGLKKVVQQYLIAPECRYTLDI